MTLTHATLLAWLAKAVATGGPFDPVATFVGLAHDVDDQGEDTVMADVTEATGGAADRVAVTAWSAPHLLNDGRWAVDGPVCEFAVTDATESQVVTYWFYASLATAGALKGFQAFDSELNMPDEFRTVGVVPRLCIDPSGKFDASVVLNG